MPAKPVDLDATATGGGEKAAFNFRGSFSDHGLKIIVGLVIAITGGAGALGVRTWFVGEKTDTKVETVGTTLGDVQDGVDDVRHALAAGVREAGRVKERVDVLDGSGPESAVRRSEYDRDRADDERRWKAVDDKQNRAQKTLDQILDRLPDDAPHPAHPR